MTARVRLTAMQRECLEDLCGHRSAERTSPTLRSLERRGFVARRRNGGKYEPPVTWHITQAGRDATLLGDANSRYSQVQLDEIAASEPGSADPTDAGEAGKGGGA